MSEMEQITNRVECTEKSEVKCKSVHLISLLGGRVN